MTFYYVNKHTPFERKCEERYCDTIVPKILLVPG